MLYASKNAEVCIKRILKTDKVHSVSVSDDAAEEVIPDLGRRNTIVPPPSLEEVEPDMENVEEGTRSIHIFSSLTLH